MIRAAVATAMVLALSGCPGSEPEEPAPLPISEARVEALRTACEADGGRFTKYGAAEARICLRTPGDAGKACTTSGDCSSDCLARSRTCAPVTPLMGCNEVLNSSGNSVLLCREF